MAHLVHRPLQMTPESYVEAMRQQTKRIYAPSVMLRKALRTLRDTRSHGAAQLSMAVQSELSPCRHGSATQIRPAGTIPA